MFYFFASNITQCVYSSKTEGGRRGKKTVFIHDIIFKGKRSVKWEDVEKYLKQYVGDIYTIDDSNDAVYIGTDLPDEYTHSNYTHILKGANAKAKANAAQGLPELIEIAAGKKFTENYKEKHTIDAMYGWYRYESRFALPVFNEVGEMLLYTGRLVYNHSVN